MANYSRELSENSGEHPEESTGVVDRPAEQSAYVLKTQFQEPNKTCHNSWVLLYEV